MLIRVAAALLLASWLSTSNGNAFWAGVLPALVMCGATLAVVRHLVAEHR